MQLLWKRLILIQCILLPTSNASLFSENSGARSIGRARIDTHEKFIHIFPGDTTHDIPSSIINSSSRHDDKLFDSTSTTNQKGYYFPKLSHTKGIYDDISRSISTSIIDSIIHQQHSSEKFVNDFDDHEGEDSTTVQLTVRLDDHTNNKNHNYIDESSHHRTTRTSKNFKTLKTGTTIVGVKTSTHVIIGADTRATEGQVVADKKCEKVHQLSKNVWCCGAGTSADLDALTRKIRYSFLLKSMIEDSIGNDNDDSYEYHEDIDEGGDGDGGNMNTVTASSNDYVMEGVEDDMGHPLGITSVSAMCHTIREELYKYNGEIGANLVLGGFDPCTNRPILVAVHPHGSIDIIPYTALGSGSLAAMGFLESRYKVGLSLDEAIELVIDAVKAGINNDLGSGSQVDLCIIDNRGVRYKRGVVIEERLVESKVDREEMRKLLSKHTLESATHDSTSSSSTMPVIDGVNGFGALPYRIKSRVVTIRDEAEIEKENDDWLRTIIK